MRKTWYSTLPEYLRIAELLRNDIISNYHAGDLYPSQNVLIRRHKVSSCTMTKALAELVAEGWLRRERGRGSFVSIPERDSDRNAMATDVIGVLMNNHQAEVELSPFMADISRYLIKAANYAGYSVQFLSPKFLTRQSLEYYFQNNPIDGLVCFNPFSLTAEVIEGLARKVPVVFSERLELSGSGLKPHSWCDFDTEGGIQRGMEHLLAHGYRRIALIIGNRSRHPLYAKRYESYRRTLEQAGIIYEPSLVYEAERFSNSAGAEAMKQLLPEKPDAVLISSASFGVSAINEILRQGWRIPEDIAVVGYDEQLFFAPAFQCLSCIEVPIQEFAEALISELLGLIKNGYAGEGRMFQPYLQAGKSVAQIN